MGTRSSRTSPEIGVQDDVSTWGSDIDDTFCGPGKICADEWTPLPSEQSSPEVIRRRFSAITVEDVITEQPRLLTSLSRNHEEDMWTNYDVMTIHEVEPIEITPVFVGKKMRRVKKLKKRRRKKQRIPKDRVNGTKQTSHRHFPIHHRIRVRRMTIRKDPRYPPIPPPGSHSYMKFRNVDYQKTGRFGRRVIPPSHLKGHPIQAKPHFRYRGTTMIIV